MFLGAGGQPCTKVVALVLGDDSAADGASCGSDSVGHEGAVFAVFGCPGGLGADVKVKALFFFVSLEVIPFVRDKAKELFE